MHLYYRRKKAKKNQKYKQKDLQAPIELDMMEDYDPIRPNDYEIYMGEQNRLKEEEERKRLQQRIARSPRRFRSHSRSDASSETSSRSRSPSPAKYNSMCSLYLAYPIDHNAD